MKKLFTAFILMVFATQSFANNIRVNNIAGVNAPYTSLAAAVAAANNGDTIYVEPSPSGYGNVIVNKKLVIVGNGVFIPTASPYTTMNPGLQDNMLSTIVSNITVQAGGDSSIITGLDIQGSLIISTSNVQAIRNRIYILYLSNYNPVAAAYQNVSNIHIAQNMFWYVVNTITANFTSTTMTNINFFNNIFTNGMSQVIFPVGITGNMAHNHMGAYTFSVYGFSFYNNVLGFGSFIPNNNVYYNNFGYNTNWGTASGNQSNVSMTGLYAYYNSSTDTAFILNNPGPGIGTGFGGADMGPYGGPSPYRRSNIPYFPSIYSLTAPANTTTNTLPVTISTRSNN